MIVDYIFEMSGIFWWSWVYLECGVFFCCGDGSFCCLFRVWVEVIVVEDFVFGDWDDLFCWWWWFWWVGVWLRIVGFWLWKVVGVVCRGGLDLWCDMVLCVFFVLCGRCVLMIVCVLWNSSWRFKNVVKVVIVFRGFIL